MADAAPRVTPATAAEVIVFGGTFDPVHAGHLEVVRALRRATSLPLLLLPAGVPGHRPVPSAPAADRAAMAAIALEELGDPGVSLSRLEVDRPGPSYTVETITEMRRRRPERELVLALGADAAAGLPTWRRPQELLRQVRLLVFDRRGAVSPARQVLERLGRLGLPLPAATAISLEVPDIDASAIRRRLASGDVCAGLVTPRVLEYIARRGLYGYTPSPDR